MDNFVVSARKYRPGTFSSVIGQDSITNTLKSAIRKNQLAQAFLFCGPRGVGKTTCARIFAKTINCEQRTEDDEACNKCNSCLSFNTSASFNIHELDGASNNSVADIRSLIDQVRIPPQVGRYKVYIIDEVHMLSSAAFNAFLKTLEEPPPYAKFILATTEKHKIIPTILSRCQIYDFKRISVEDIVRQLEFVAKSENVTADPDALHIIAQKSDGAMRDALSIFDQLVSFSGNVLEYKHVIENLNVLDYEYYFQITDNLLSNNIPQTMLLIDEIINNGFDGQHFIIGLGEHLRNLLVCKDSVTVRLLEVSAGLKERYHRQSAACDTGWLLKALELINRCDIDYRMSNNKRMLVELTVLQIGNNLHSKLQLDASGISETAPVPVATTPASPKKEEISGSQAYKSDIQAPAALAEPEAEIEKAPEKPVVKRTFIPTSGVSIKKPADGQAETEKDEAKDLSDTKMNEDHPFTAEELEKTWEVFARSVAAGSPNLHATLTQSTPRIADESNSIILFAIHSQLQQQEISNARPELIAFLKENLKNSQISIQTEMVEAVKEAIPYTSVEKYQKMNEKNPNLNNLKNKLSLELDF
ncbi:MAG: DNA polymerase III subunit gamma/tau [Bacteroidales bacterium]|jgi:DNA polymerase-3 subunit gamma/tau|nr:DNA polymerase III subunit gamma/tau [Bacteroidales bacterium]